MTNVTFAQKREIEKKGAELKALAQKELGKGEHFSPPKLLGEDCIGAQRGQQDNVKDRGVGETLGKRQVQHLLGSPCLQLARAYSSTDCRSNGGID